MARTKQLQTNFSAGELAPELAMRQDTKQYANGAKSLRNRRCLIGGGSKRRPATWHQADLTQSSRAEPFTVDQSTKYVLCFSSGRVDAFVQDIVTKRLTAAGNVTGCPWTGNLWREMDLVQSGNTMFLVHKNMPVQRLVRTGAATWTRTVIVFASGPANRPEQPYFKLVDDAITLQPSALVGSITLLASAAVFVAGHVGLYIRYQKKALLVTAFTDTTHVTATVIETLPRTQTLTVKNDATEFGLGTANFAVGEAVQGLKSGAKGEVTAVTAADTLSVAITDGLTPFVAHADEKLIGPNGKVEVTAVADTTPAAVKNWDEQLFSAVRGYPSCVELHRNRLCFGGHPAVPDGLITSRLNNLFNFNVDDGSDADAIFETVGDAGASQIVQLHSAEQLLVLTDHGPYYVPESQAAPFRPSNMAFFPFGSPWPVTRSAKASQFDNGVLFASGSLVIKASPTGDLSRAWAAHEVSLLSSHIISNPTRLAVISNFAGGPERYAMAINDDGTMAAMQLVEQEEIRNVTPWDTSGVYTSAAALGGDLYVTTERTIGGTLKFYLEWFDQSITVDLATQYADLAALNAGVPTRYGSTEVHVLVGTLHLDTFPLSTATPPGGPYVAGLYYDTQIETLPPVVQDQEGSKAGELMRICQAFVSVKDSHRFALNGYTISAYQVTDPVDRPPPVRNGPIKFEPLGWKREPTLVINQPEPLPLEVLAIKTVVAY